MANNKQLNAEDLKEVAKAQGEKLAFFITSLNVPEEQKQGWLALLPSMSPEQLDRFMNVLEAQYLDQQTKDVDDKFKKDLEKVQTDFAKKEKDLDDQTIKKIQDLSAKLD
mgnify:FL=1